MVTVTYTHRLSHVPAPHIRFKIEAVARRFDTIGEPLKEALARKIGAKRYIIYVGDNHMAIHAAVPFAYGGRYVASKHRMVVLTDGINI